MYFAVKGVYIILYYNIFYINMVMIVGLCGMIRMYVL